MRALITQREAVDRYGELTDVLEARYVRWFAELGVFVQPVSNFLTQACVPPLEREADVLILTGGGELPPQFYRERRGPGDQPHRDQTEYLLIERFRAKKKPILAICRGMQYLNGLMGGKISRLDALKTPRPVRVDHPVEIEGEQWFVNQFHKDGIFTSDLASGLDILAVDRENGVVEAFTASEERILALQWHPERPFSDVRTQEKTEELIRHFLKIGV